MKKTTLHDSDPSSTGALKRRRKAINPYSNGGGEGDFCSLGLQSASACILLLFFVGFSLTTSYLSASCSTFDGGGSLRTTTATATTAPLPEVAAAAPATTVVVASFPPACTEAQSSAALRQLPPDGCSRPAYEQACSFTKATTRINPCRDNRWMREFFAGTELASPFRAFFLPYPGPSIEPFSTVPLDLLYVGTHDPKYQAHNAKWAEWTGKEYGGERYAATCLGDVATTTTATASAVQEAAAKVVLVSAPVLASTIAEYRNKLEIPEERMEAISHEGRYNDAFFGAKLPAPGSPIHYLRIASLDALREIKDGFTRITDVWYLEFTLEAPMKGGLSSYDQSHLLQNFLPEKGFVCYWDGVKDLWRINGGCWHDHYSTPTWSNVACVNAGIPEAKPLLDRMEKVFADTIAKGDGIAF